MRTKSATIIILALFVCLLCACAKQTPEEHVNISDPMSGSMIATKADLLAFFEESTSDTVHIAANIDLGDDMISVDAERGDVIIEGGGYTISSSSDCVIRLMPDAGIVLNDVTLMGEGDGIGIIDAGTVGGKNSVISGAMHGIECGSRLTIANGSTLTVKGVSGCGAKAEGVRIGEGASVTASGGSSAVVAFEYDLELMKDSKLVATGTGEDQYYIVKVAGELSLASGALFSVTNSGDYHGAEIGYLSAAPDATLEAKGGSVGVGIFIITLKQDVTLKGFCEPPARHENGKGTLIFE